MPEMTKTLSQHWPEYLMEAAGLGIFMISAGLFATLLEHPHSPIHQAVSDPLARRALMGLVIGLTAIVIIYSPWGQQSGAHLNPALTLTFFGLGKIAFWDTIFYVAAQFVGGSAGIVLVYLALGEKFAEPPIAYIVTVPGAPGAAAAFIAEMVISFGLMLMVLITTNIRPLARYTGIFAGLLLFVYIVVEAPLSGMSLNPARTLASALPGGQWSAVWIYFAAPLSGMLLAALLYQTLINRERVACAKLNHHTSRRCIFLGCGYRRQEKMADEMKGKNNNE